MTAPAAVAPVEPPPHSLARTLGLRDLVLIVVGTVIGSGIFLVPSTVLRQTGGNVSIAFTVWVVAGILSLLGALTFAEMGAAKPDAGGLYVYIRDAFGPLPAFLYGWTAFFVLGSGSVATLAVAFTAYLRQLVPVSPVAANVVAVVIIAILMAVNVRGARQGSDVQNVSTAIKAGAIIVMSAVLLMMGGDSPPPAAPVVSTETSMISGIGLAMIGVLWAYEGWQYATFSAGETIDPQRTFPRAMVVGTIFLIAIYLLANVAYLAALGADGVMASERVAADAMSAALGPAAGKVIAAVILVSMFSAANGITLTAPRLYYSMARDRVFFAKLAQVHPRFGTPALAIVVSSLWAMLLAVTGTFEQLLTYVVFVGWIFYALGGLAIFVYRRRHPDMARPFRTPGYPVTPILFVASAVAIVLNTIVSQPGRAAVGLGFMVVGVPAYFIWRARSRA
jgi:basic amino acid/polyamine antiporter, APA family